MRQQLKCLIKKFRFQNSLPKKKNDTSFEVAKIVQQDENEKFHVKEV